VLGDNYCGQGLRLDQTIAVPVGPKSIADFISKMGIVEEEADESLYWMELLIEAGIEVNMKMEALMKEAGSSYLLRLPPSKRQEKARICAEGESRSDSGIKSAIRNPTSEIKYGSTHSSYRYGCFFYLG